MEARKASKEVNGTGGIPLAYVDHNGNLVDTPPDPSLKVEVELESIAINVTKKEHIEEDPIRNGKVSFFDSSKGFGFIIDLENQEKYLLYRDNHPNALANQLIGEYLYKLIGE